MTGPIQTTIPPDRHILETIPLTHPQYLGQRESHVGTSADTSTPNSSIIHRIKQTICLIQRNPPNVVQYHVL